VGICWRCSETHSLDGLRSAPLKWFAPLAAVPGVTLVSLQKGPGVEDVRKVTFPVHELIGLDESGEAFLDSAAIMTHLDLVVSCDSSPAHLAGALGVPVWAALTTGCDWR
jgi:hypothetical protein